MAILKGKNPLFSGQTYGGASGGLRRGSITFYAKFARSYNFFNVEQILPHIFNIFTTSQYIIYPANTLYCQSLLKPEHVLALLGATGAQALPKPAHQSFISWRWNVVPPRFCTTYSRWPPKTADSQAALSLSSPAPSPKNPVTADSTPSPAAAQTKSCHSLGCSIPDPRT